MTTADRSTAAEPAPLSAGGDPLEYAAYIVYAKRKGETPVNNKIKALCGDYQELVLQYVEDIAPADRPSWLRGVPTVVCLPTYAITVGTPALEEIEKWAAGRPKAVGQAAAPGGGVSLAGGFSAPLAADEDEADVNRYSSLEDLLRRRAEGPGGQSAQPQ
jgi:hypothetical protein